jgi:hypothetical protein
LPSAEKTFGNKLGTRPHGHNAGIAGFQYGFAVGCSAYLFSHKNGAAFAQFARHAQLAGGEDIAAQAPDIGEGFAGIRVFRRGVGGVGRHDAGAGHQEGQDDPVEGVQRRRFHEAARIRNDTI